MTSKNSTKKKHIKLDAINRKIIEKIHANASLTNQQLAEEIGLSAPACSHRVASLKEAGYFFNFHCEVDLDRTFRHVLAYVEFQLSSNDVASRNLFEQEIEKHPEFMDCLRLSGEVDYMSFTCSRDIKELNRLCDLLCENTGNLISRLNIRIVIERAKWYLGYPLAKLEWLE